MTSLRDWVETTWTTSGWQTSPASIQWKSSGHPLNATSRRLRPMLRPALFAFVGVAFFAHWVVTDPSFGETATQSEWRYVLAFSGVILLLGLVIPLLAEVVGGRLVFRVSLVAATGAALSSVANIFEDGMHMEWV